MALETLKKFNPKEKKQIVKYISKYCKNLKTNEDKNTFDIGSEKELKVCCKGRICAQLTYERTFWLFWHYCKTSFP